MQAKACQYSCLSIHSTSSLFEFVQSYCLLSAYHSIRGKSVLLWQRLAVWILFESKVVEHELIITPIRLDLDPALQIDSAAKEFFTV